MPEPAKKPLKKPSAATPVITFRRRPRAFTGCLSGILFVVVILTASFFLGSYLWACVSDVLAFSKKDVNASVEYTSDMSIASLAAMLKEEGLIQYPWLFKLYCGFSDAEEKMQPGHYTITEKHDYRTLVNSLNQRSDSRAQVTVVLREGLTLKQTFALLEENGVASVTALEEAAAVGNYRYSYLQNLPALPGRLEGYLFPDTYDFYVDMTPTAAVAKMLSNFDGKLTGDMRRRAEDTGRSIQEILIVASLIEMESSADMDERKNIASVIYNRLASKDYPYLQIDATIQYFLPERVERVLYEHLEIDNPYNTYMYPGLPPGPICNPSADSLRAALYPNKTDYYFYLLDDAGKTVFCKTAAEFNKVKANNPGRYG